MEFTQTANHFQFAIAFDSGNSQNYLIWYLLLFPLLSPILVQSSTLYFKDSFIAVSLNVLATLAEEISKLEKPTVPIPYPNSICGHLLVDNSQ